MELFEQEALMKEAERRFKSGDTVYGVSMASFGEPFITKKKAYVIKNIYWAIGTPCPAATTTCGDYIALYVKGLWAENANESKSIDTEVKWANAISTYFNLVSECRFKGKEIPDMFKWFEANFNLIQK